MATDRPLIRRRRIFAAAVETTTGTAITLDATYGKYNAFNTELTPNIPMGERELQGSMSSLSAVPGARSGSLRLSTHLHGLGSTGNPIFAGTLLRAAGFGVSSQTFTVDSDDETTLTAGMFEDGRYRVLAGCKADLTAEFVSGQPVLLNWNLTGKFIEPSAVALIAPDYPEVIPPRFAGATLTVGGTAYKVPRMTLSLGNQIVMRENAAAADDPIRTANGQGTGYHAAVIATRKPRLTMTVEAPAYGTKNWEQDWMNGTEAALNCVIGATTHNIITITAPKLQLMNVQPGDGSGIMQDVLEFGLNRNADAGDDELVITFS